MQTEAASEINDFGTVSTSEPKTIRMPIRNSYGIQFAETLIDEIDYKTILTFKLKDRQLHIEDGYAMFSASRVWLHHFVVRRMRKNVPVGYERDHKNCVRLDNTRANLRVVTIAQNQQNKLPRQGSSSAYVGVSFCNNRWKASLSGVCLGRFDLESHAAFAYDEAVRALFQDGRTNDIPRPESYVHVPVPIQPTIREPRRILLGTQYFGVTHYTTKNDKERWIARLRYRGTTEYLGSFDSEECAAFARDLRCKQLFGDRARIIGVPRPHNFPDDYVRPSLRPKQPKRKREGCTEIEAEETDEPFLNASVASLPGL